ncbi:hypothetical protein Droror1_Dr00015341 [Drosera rotundifolia]
MLIVRPMKILLLHGFVDAWPMLFTLAQVDGALLPGPIYGEMLPGPRRKGASPRCWSNLGRCPAHDALLGMTGAKLGPAGSPSFPESLLLPGVKPRSPAKSAGWRRWCGEIRARQEGRREVRSSDFNSLPGTEEGGAAAGRRGGVVAGKEGIAAAAWEGKNRGGDIQRGTAVKAEEGARSTGSKGKVDLINAIKL